MIYLGTTNSDKVAEIAALLSPLRVELKTIALDVPETEDTFEGNARLKGIAYAKHTGGITISEDSGLIIPALGGLPGPWSARFCDCILDLATGKVSSVAEVHPRGRAEMDVVNNNRVLELLRTNWFTREERFKARPAAAMFKVVLVVASPSGILFQSSGECHGWIAEEARGTNGFGYDSIFIGQDTFGKTFAELDTPRKNQRSHRKRVLDELFMWASQHRELL